MSERASEPVSAQRRRLRAAGKLILSLAILCLAAEGILRFAIFDQGNFARRYGHKLRNADHFASPNTDCYWKLQSTATPASKRKPTPDFDPILGWRGGRIREGDYALVDDDAN